MTASRYRILSRAALATLLLSSSAAWAGPVEVPVPPAPAPSSGWEFRIEPYGWLAGITGESGVAYQTVPTDLSFRDLASHLKMTFAAQMELRYDRWGLLTDIYYADIGGYKNIPDPRIQQFAVDLKSFIFQFPVTYRVYRSKTSDTFLDLLAGGRLNSTRVRLSRFQDVSVPIAGLIVPPDFRYFSNSATKTWVDPIVGGRTQVFLSNNIFLGGYGDIGGFGVGSHLSWQVQGTLGYKFNRKMFAEIGWRLLSENYTSGGFTYNAKQQGLYTGFSYTF